MVAKNSKTTGKKPVTVAATAGKAAPRKKSTPANSTPKTKTASNKIGKKVVKPTKPAVAKPKAAPAKPKAAPAKPKPAPAKPKAVPAKPKAVPAKPKTVPAKPKTVPVKPKPAPAKPVIKNTSVSKPVMKSDKKSENKIVKKSGKAISKENAEIISKMRQQLLARREAIMESLNADLGSDVRNQATGDTGDAAMDSMHSEMRSQMAENESRELTKIVNALHKMESGEYGLCEDCGRQIPLPRLQAIPFATLCLECQQAEEEDSYFDDDEPRSRFVGGNDNDE